MFFRLGIKICDYFFLFGKVVNNYCACRRTLCNGTYQPEPGYNPLAKAAAVLFSCQPNQTDDYSVYKHGLAGTENSWHIWEYITMIAQKNSLSFTDLLRIGARLNTAALLLRRINERKNSVPPQHAGIYMQNVREYKLVSNAVIENFTNCNSYVNLTNTSLRFIWHFLTVSFLKPGRLKFFFLYWTQPIDERDGHSDALLASKWCTIHSKLIAI